MVWLENKGEISKYLRQQNAVCWELPNYFAYQLKTDVNKVDPYIVSSPLFSAFNNKWQLTLISNTEKGIVQYVGFFLRKMQTSNEAPDINVKLILLNSYGGGYQSCDGNLDLDGSFGSWTFITVTTLSKCKTLISPTGFLKLVCKMEKNKRTEDEDLQISSDVEDEESNENTLEEHAIKSDVPEAKGVDRLLQNLKTIFLDEQNSDLVLKVQEVDFKVHKTILTARSPVFASMFKHDTKESTSGKVDIPDCSSVAFKDFLLYLYTASTDSMSSDNVFDLYYAADKYQVNDLKAECIEYMENNMSVENFCSVMSLSLQHSETELQKKAMEFFSDNVKTIIKTVHWQKYLRDYPTEANELFIKAINA